MTHTLEETVGERDAPGVEAIPDARPASAGSTLIEFPGARSLPQWRKELSERVREIQQRKAREAALDAEQAADFSPEQMKTPAPPTVSASPDISTAADDAAEEVTPAAPTHLGLVPSPPDAPEMNPLVAAALARIERARQQSSTPATSVRSGAANRRAAATAVARAAEERYEPQARPQAPPKQEPRVAPARQQSAPAPEALQTPDAPEAPRPPSLVAVPSQAPPAVEQKRPPRQTTPAEPARVEPAAEVEVTKVKTVAQIETDLAQAEAAAVAARAEKPKPRRVVEGVVDEAWLARLEERILPPVNAAARTADDVAPLVPRVAAGLLDLLFVAFLSSPFAAIIELTNGNWDDPRVVASMAGIVLVVLFLYETVSTGLAGRTFAMSFFRLYSVDAETALAPTLGQCVRRTLLYIVSLATFGLGILYALFDAERRAAHDHLSGTVVVRH